MNDDDPLMPMFAKLVAASRAQQQLLLSIVASSPNAEEILRSFGERSQRQNDMLLAQPLTEGTLEDQEQARVELLQAVTWAVANRKRT